MKVSKLLFLLFCIVCMCSSCIQSFTPEIEKYEALLVVDGWLTDAPGPYTIKLSVSSQLKELSKYTPYTGCKLSITDNLGNKYPLTESKNGVYVTDSAGFRSIVGRKYKLHITTVGGDEVESREEELLQPAEIDKVYGELEHKSDPSKFFGRDGYQFYIDLKPIPANDNFFFWSLNCTYKFRADFPIFFYYDNGKRYEVLNNDTLRTCYRNVDILDLFVLNTSDLKQADVKHFPLNYEDNYTKALSMRYSLNVKQYKINQLCYEYWNTIKKLRDTQSDLYTQQPYQAKNNLVNLTHPDVPVLGYFTVAGFSETRIFVDHPPIENRFDVCVIQGDPVKHLDDFLWKHPNLWPYFFPEQKYGDHFIDQGCLDCRKTGVMEKPTFWID